MREELVKMGYKKLSLTDEQKAVERARKLACCLKDYKSLIEEAKKEQRFLEKKESEYLQKEAEIKGEEGTLEGDANHWWKSHPEGEKGEGKMAFQSTVAVPFEQKTVPATSNIYMYIYTYIYIYI